MAKAQKHAHKFRRHRFSTGNTIFFCALPDCGYKISPALALGKRAVCWKCGNEFLMDDYTCRLAKPHCKSCHVPKDKGVSDLLAVARIVAPDIEADVTEIPDPPMPDELKERLNRELSEDSAAELSRRLRGNFGLEGKPDEDIEI